MLRLTNAHPDSDVRGQPILIAAKHVVSVRPVNGGTGILTVTGVDYTVAESMYEIGKMDAWNTIH